MQLRWSPAAVKTFPELSNTSGKKMPAAQRIAKPSSPNPWYIPQSKGRSQVGVRKGCSMKTLKFTYWKDGNFYLGFLNDYPDYQTQGSSKEALVTNHKSFLSDL